MLELENNFKKNGGFQRTKRFLLEELLFGESGDVDIQNKDLTSEGEYFINSGVTNLGIKGKTSRKAKIFEGNTITIDFFGNAYYRDFKYKLATHNHVFSFSGEVIKNRLVGLYLVGSMKKFPKKYSYSNMATLKKLYKEEIELPVDNKNNPDYVYMEDYIRELEENSIRELDRYLKVAGLDNEEMNSHEISLIQQLEKGSLDKKSKLFEVKNLFSILKIKHMLKKSATSEVGIYPVFSSDTSNNGIIGYTEDPEFLVDQENPIYVIFGDHTRRLNFTDVNFSVADNVKVLKPTHASLFDSDCLLFIFTLWKKQIKNLGYARHWKIAKDCLIDLPVTPEGEIDVKTIRATVNAIKKLVIADVVKFKNEYIEKSKQAIK